MARYVIETKQLDGGVWLASGVDSARSKVAAIKMCEEHAVKFACPKRVVDTKTGEVLHTVGDDEFYNRLSERNTRIMRLWEALDVAFKALEGQIVPVETMKKGDQWNQHGGGFELLEDPHASSSHVEGLGPSDVVVAPCVCVFGECGGYFQPGSEWTLQGRVNLVKVHKIG